MDHRRSAPAVSRRTFLAATGTAALAGCLGAPSRGTIPAATDATGHPTPTDDPVWDTPSDSPRAALTTETLVENLEIPWDIAFTPTGDLFLTQRTGSLLRFDAGSVAEVTAVPDAIDAGSVAPGSDREAWWVEGGEGGTLGVATHPAYPEPPHLFLYYTTTAGGGRSNRVVRVDVEAPDPAATAEPILAGIPANKWHNGGRVAFGPDGYLWVTTGDAGSPKLAEDTGSLAGKVLRVTPDGDPAPDNPDLGGDPRVFTFGHRNPQGLAWLPTGVPLATEHGPSGRDEVNVLYPGGNYGWPTVRGYPGDDEYGPYAAHPDIVPPVVNIGDVDSWAPTGAVFYTGDAVPAWRNRLVIGGLVSQAVWVVTLTPPGFDPPPTDGVAFRYDAPWMDPHYDATVHRTFHDDLGRVRHLAQGPDGGLYAITSNRDGRATDNFPREKDDVLVRITPA
ncbi:PQQ-dependent sugar dehydrogenase [Halobacteriales archaeon Cl-PHB]